MATHLDSDHDGGLLGILDRYHAGSVLHSVDPAQDAALGSQWRGLLSHRQHPGTVIRAGHRIQLGREVVLEAVHPPQDGLPAWVKDNAHNGSMVLRLEYGDVSLLLTGDIATAAERHLAAAAGEKLRADVLRVAHHGSRTSTSPEFLAAVSPQSAVISAGRGNRFGHTHAEVVDRLEASVGANHVFLTARDGTVEYISDGTGLWVRTHGTSRR